MSDKEIGSSSEIEAYTPRELLEHSLRGKEAGSIESLAIADWSEITILEAAIKLQGETPLLTAKIAAIGETIRTRKFGKGGTRYNFAFEDAKKLRAPYEKQAMEITKKFWENQGKEPPAFDKNFNKIKAMYEIQNDLLEINSAKIP